MPECAHERQTCHYRGRWYGFGPVQDNERLILAVFDQTPRSADSLTSNSFKHLVDNSESVCRAFYVTSQVFETQVAQPGQQTKGAFVGITVASARSIRRLRTDFTMSHRMITVQSICVTDRVEPGDYDGHATMGFSEPIEALGQTLKGKKRLAIRMDLAKEFSRIHEIQDHHWPGHLKVLRFRLASVLREAKLAFRVRIQPLRRMFRML
jgi:hypothetical protein